MKAFCSIVVLVVLLLAAQSNAETTAYIPNRGDDTITRVDTTDETFDSVTLADSPYGAAVTPDGVYVFVTRSGSGQLNRVPANNFTNAGAQVEITVGTDPRGVAVEPEGDYAYVANFDDDTVSKVNVSSGSVADAIAVGNGPLGVAADYDQTDDTPLVYVTNNLGNSLTVIGKNDETTTISNLCNAPAGVAVTPNGNFAYVACTDDDTVKVVRTSDNASVVTINVGDAPWGVAVGSDGEYVYVTNSGADTVSVIATSDNSVIETPAVGDEPRGVAAPRNGDFAYVVNQTDDSIHKIDISTDPATVTEIGVNEVDSADSLGAFIGGEPPTEPDNLEAEANGSDEIDLTWDDNSTDESGFKIERREDSVDAYTQVAKVDADETSYTDSGLEGATTYHYRVRAYNEAADSAASSSAEATTDEANFSWCFIGSLLFF